MKDRNTKVVYKERETKLSSTRTSERATTRARRMEVEEYDTHEFVLVYKETRKGSQTFFSEEIYDVRDYLPEQYSEQDVVELFKRFIRDFNKGLRSDEMPREYVRSYRISKVVVLKRITETK